MNGLSLAILAATPLALAVLYFALSGQQQVRTDLERQDVKQEIEAAKFDLEFEQMSHDIDGEQMSAEQLAARQEHIITLQKKSAEWDKRFDAEFEQADKELDELKSVLEEAQ